MADEMDTHLHAQVQQTQQQHDDHQMLQALPTQPQHTGAIDSLTCQWVNCGERCSSPEALYDHVCDRHIGRKSTNNLNLTCAWGACRTTTVKRDHITSHMRVHVPLKPHKCDFCGKAFKRPQDLKKHVKTHADDSVLLRSPEANMGQQQGPNNGFHQQDNKNGAYFQGGHDLSGPYPPPNNIGANNNFYPTPQYSGYGQVNYPGTSLADQQSMDTRRRAIEALNDFLGDVKRRSIDPGNYYDVGQRLNTQSLPLPVSIGAGYSLGSNYNSTSTSYGNGGGGMESFGGSHGGLSMDSGGVGLHGALSQNYSIPISNARSKTDLLDIDRFLEQLQATVYESSNQAAAAGVQQPGIHSQAPGRYPGFNSNIRHSQSPPNMQHQNSASGTVQPLSSVAQMANMTATAQGLDTPALTPASLNSYASSGHSPTSSHSRASGDGRSMYPQLPSVAGISDMGQGYSSAPPSGLASGFEPFDSRRYSGGRLQREAPGPRHKDGVDSDAMDTEEDGAQTPRKAEIKERRRGGSSSNVDPALRGSPTSESPEEAETTEHPQSDSSEDRAQEAWVENVRVIEFLRSWVRDRLAQGEFERDEESTPEAQQPDLEEGIDERLKREFSAREEAERREQEQEQRQQQEEINYPTLKVEA